MSKYQVSRAQIGIKTLLNSLHLFSVLADNTCSELIK